MDGCTEVAAGASGKNRSYRVLMVTGIYPTAARPDKGTYIKSQVDSLIAAGLEVEVIHPCQGNRSGLSQDADGAFRCCARALWVVVLDCAYAVDYTCRGFFPGVRLTGCGDS